LLTRLRFGRENLKKHNNAMKADQVMPSVRHSYWTMRIEDLVRYGTDEEIQQQLHFFEAQLSNLAAKIRTSKPRNEKYLALYNLTIYAVHQLNRLRLMEHPPTEYYAWITRNLFEIYLIILYILSSPEHLRNFFKQRAMDEIQILEGVKELAESPHQQEVIILESRINEIKKVLFKHEAQMTKHLPTAKLAKITGMEKEYKAFFKLYSKYVHPSSWVVNAKPEEAHSPEFRNIFLIQAQLYTGFIAKKVSDETNIPLDNA